MEIDFKQRESLINAHNYEHHKLEELNKKFNYNDLNYIVISTDEETDFTKVQDPVSFLDDIKKGKGAKILESKRKKLTALNILTPKQMLQRLPIALTNSSCR